MCYAPSSSVICFTPSTQHTYKLKNLLTIHIILDCSMKNIFFVYNYNYLFNLESCILILCICIINEANIQNSTDIFYIGTIYMYIYKNL